MCGWVCRGTGARQTQDWARQGRSWPKWWTAGPDWVPQADDRDGWQLRSVPGDTIATPIRDPWLHGTCANLQGETSQDAACLRTHPHSSGRSSWCPGPAPVPPPKRRAAEQPTGPPPAHIRHQPELEEEARKGPAKPEELSLYIISVKT